MSEQPILMIAESVRAILAGRKTETRRVAASIRQSWCIVGGGRAWADLDFKSPRVFADGGPSPAGNPGPYLHVPWRNETMQRVYPRIQVGDRLWVREALEQYWEGDVGYHTIRYACDKQDVETDAPESWDYGGPRQRCILHDACTQTIPSIHMPKWAARLWLEVVGVRVERVQDISEGDARAEGAPFGIVCLDSGAVMKYRHPDTFARSWDAQNAKRGFGWDANPWVWVIRFKRSEA